MINGINIYLYQEFQLLTSHYVIFFLQSILCLYASGITLFGFAIKLYYVVLELHNVVL